MFYCMLSVFCRASHDVNCNYVAVSHFVESECTAKNATDLFQVVNFTSLLQQTCQYHQVKCKRQTCCNLSFADLLQLVEATYSKTVNNKF